MRVIIQVIKREVSDEDAINLKAKIKAAVKDMEPVEINMTTTD